jgi:hypothetical protein
VWPATFSRPLFLRFDIRRFHGIDEIETTRAFHNSLGNDGGYPEAVVVNQKDAITGMQFR